MLGFLQGRQGLKAAWAPALFLFLGACAMAAERVTAPGAEELAPDESASLLCDGNCHLLASLETGWTLTGETLWESRTVILAPGGYRLEVLWQPKGYFGGMAYVTDIGSFWIKGGERFAVRRCDYKERSDQEDTLFLAYRVFWIEDADSGEVIRDWPGRGTTEACR